MFNFYDTLLWGDIKLGRYVFHMKIRYKIHKKREYYEFGDTITKENVFVEVSTKIAIKREERNNIIWFLQHDFLLSMIKEESYA